MIMKKLLILLILSLSSLPASQGTEVFKKYCVSCHFKTDMSVRFKKAKHKAPAMNRVSQRLKLMTTSKHEFITFAKDYIQNPSQDKGYCRPKAYKNYGVMPPIGKIMSEKERDIVLQWLYNNFNSSDDMRSSCATQEMSKCGTGKR
jgi:hypothetical protein